MVHLVEEQRPGACQLEEALLPCMRAGECAALVAEQLGLEQVFRNRRAVDRDERFVGACAGVMDAAREQLLPSSRFADQQHRRATRGRDPLGESSASRRTGLSPTMFWKPNTPSEDDPSETPASAVSNGTSFG